jgi:hypothetical protein
MKQVKPHGLEPTSLQILTKKINSSYERKDPWIAVTRKWLLNFSNREEKSIAS